MLTAVGAVKQLPSSKQMPYATKLSAQTVSMILLLSLGRNATNNDEHRMYHSASHVADRDTCIYVAMPTPCCMVNLVHC